MASNTNRSKILTTLSRLLSIPDSRIAVKRSLKKCRALLGRTATIAALTLAPAMTVPAAPFACPSDAFLFQNQPSDVFRVDLATGDAALAADNITPANRSINAIGYNITDHCIWGSLRGASGQISRICDDATFAPTNFAITGLPGEFDVGDVSLNGLLYLYFNGTTRFYAIDVNPNSPTYLTLVATLNTTVPNINDWAFNPLDGQLYAARNGRNTVLYRFDPATGARTDLGALTGGGIENLNVLFGAVYFDAAGHFYMSDNNTGRIYRVRDVADGNLATDLFTIGPRSGLNDGARCAQSLLRLDFGDAPNSYGTTLASDGARHSVREPVTDMLQLGGFGIHIWFEDDANAPFDGSGDTLDDGVGLLPNIDPNNVPYTLDVTAYNGAGRPAATLYGWIDFDQSGTFEADEATTAPVPAGTDGPVALSWPVIPADQVAGDTYLRLRLTSDPAITSATPTGPAADGEVEDHRVTIWPPTPGIGASKQLADLDVNRDGSWTATFTIGVTNLGNEPLEALQISEDLADFPAGTTVDEVIAATLEVNPNYAPGLDDNLLTGTHTNALAVGETKYITLVVTFTPDGNQPYQNQATASATGTLSNDVTNDLSDNGTQADSDGDGNADEAGENDPTPTNPVITPVIGTAKQLADLSDNGDGSWTATFSLAVTNLGTEPLDSLQISEDLADFPAGTTVDDLSSATLAVNPNYAPGIDNNLLAGTDVLAIGDTQTVTLAIRFTPDGNQPYTNQATGSGSGTLSGQTSNDPSDNGTAADSDGDGNPNEAGENDPTSVNPRITPVIGTTKQLADLSDNGDGSWTATFSLAVTNLGNEPLDIVQIREDLVNFPATTTVDRLTSAQLAVNPNYAPGVDNHLLTGTDGLAIGETKTVTLVITFTPDGNQPYINQATGSATGAQSAQGTSDPSDNGTRADADGDGNPDEAGENDPTPTSPVITPVIGTAKQLASLSDNGDGSWTATFSIGVTNLGNEPLDSLQIREDLADFPTATTVDNLTSALLAVNPNYAPGIDNNLLAGTDVLAIHETKTVTLVISFTPDGNQPYTNRAIGSGSGTLSAQPTSDPSDNGSNADSDGDGEPNEPGENDPTPTSPTITPVIGTAKQLASLSDNGDGSWTATFSIAVTNLGNEPLDSVQISEDLADFPNGTTVDSLTSALLAVNANYAPGVDNNMLTGTDVLAIGETQTVTLVITFTPDGNQPYTNQATGSGNGAQSGQTSADPSDNGSDTDSDGDGNPNEPGENDPTAVNPTITPVIGTAKQLADLTDNGDGSWTATFSLAVTNLGNEPLDSVQITEDLADFPNGTTVDNLGSAVLAVNPNYTPGVDNNLLAGTDVLAIGQTKTVTLVITFTPDGNQPYTNQATGSGNGAQSGQTSADPSDNGSDADGDGDGNPNEPGENDPTAVNPTITPVIGTAKQLADLTDNGNGSWTATFSLAVTNLGNEPLNALQITEDLADFPNGTTVDSLTSAQLAVNANYAPGVDNNLLAGTDVLAIGQTKTVTLMITFTPDGNQPYTNQATGSGNGAQSGQTSSDPSDSGSDADGDGDGNPNEPGENDPTAVNPTITPVIGTAKQLSSLSDNGNGSWTATFSIAVTNLGNEPLNALQISEDLADFPNGTTVDSLSSAQLAVNANYAPGVDDHLLSGTDGLAIGETRTVTLVITFTPDGSQPYTNSATGSGSGAQSGQTSSDPSDNGSHADGDGDGNPNEPGENDPTPVNPAITPVIGTTKQLSGLSVNSNGNWTATFSIAVTNLGNEPLNALRIREDLADFPAGTTVDSLASTQLAVNPNYAPDVDDHLLTGTDILAIGETKTVTLVITFTPDGNQPYTNQATGSGRGAQSGQTSSDPSDNGSHADSDGDGNPDEPGENDPTPVNPVLTPVIGTTKQLSSLNDNGDGSWTARFSLGVTNLGSEPLNTVQIREDLADFPAGTTVDSLSSTQLAVNPNYAPGSDDNLLTGTDILAIGETKTVTLVITFTPGGNLSYTNQATSSGNGAQSGQTTTDRSDNGSDADADGDGNPDEPGENDPTPVNPVLTPVIGTAKQLSSLSDNGDGSWTATFSIGVTNLGNEPLNAVQISDDLADFPAGTTVDSLSATALTVNPNYAPGSDNNLLTGTDALAIGATRTVTLVVTFTPDGNPPYTNQATGSASGAQSGQATTDRSDNGSDADGDGDGNPDEPGENDPTLINPVLTPVIGTAKAAGTVLDNSDGSYTVTITLSVENLGNVRVSNVQLSDDLTRTFPAPATFSVANLSSPSLTLNSAFDGAGDTRLLTGSDTLAVGAVATVSFAVTFTPNGLAGPFNNQATGSAQGPGGDPVSDLSNNGSDPDPNGDGDPGAPDENNLTPIALEPGVSPVEIPVLNPWFAILLALLLIVSAGRVHSRRRE